MKFKEFLASYSAFLASSPREELKEGSRYVFLSDLHLGDGGSRDDLAPNRGLVQNMLSRYYLERGYTLVLNGDIEDLSKFRYTDIRAAWSSLYAVFDAFAKEGRLRKLVGNHDLGLLRIKDHPYELSHGLVLERGRDRLFVFHGHQASKFFTRHDYLSDFIVRYLAKPLKIRNTSVDDDSKRRFKTERRIYRASRALGVVAVTGHTHRPLFESLSKYDSLRWAIEELVAEYPLASGPRREAVAEMVELYRDELSRLGKRELAFDLSRSLYDRGSLLVPCLFNSGCATGKHGATAIEYAGGELALVHWTGKKGPRPYVEREALMKDRIEGTPYARYILRSSPASHVFARVELLGRGKAGK
ncbi:MAG TPA: serine/threonine protein phosphatase [Spirochaetia bacterium]|nr:serine/threonine protein phosphatase [Spirochaetales bacterium]HRY73743.1 serine/threonine protein phosphatase [Spirochaetia bacterium]